MTDSLVPAALGTEGQARSAPTPGVALDAYGLDNPVLAAVMQALYDSEINCSVSCFWDGGWDFKLGSEIGGYVARANFDALICGARWLRAEAIKHYPTSQFAALYRGMVED